MARLHIEVDDEALAEAAELLGTKTSSETIGAALQEVVQRHERLRVLDEGRARHTNQ